MKQRTTREAVPAAPVTAGPMAPEQRAKFDRDGYLIISGALSPDEVAAAREAVVPGSHLVNWIDGPPRRDIEWPDPGGAIEVTAGPGDAVFFDRRIWHARSRNYSEHTRKAVFFGYTYRWTAIRDDIAPLRASAWFGRLAPVQQQLLGGGRGRRRGPRVGPRPGPHPVVRLAEGARLS